MAVAALMVWLEAVAVDVTANVAVAALVIGRSLVTTFAWAQVA
jgi:hypothetical protein